MLPALTQILKAIWAWLNVLIPFGKPVHGKRRLSDNSKCCDPVPDGCTGVPDFDFRDVCDRHDLDYAAGGTDADRRRADEALRQGILDKGHPILARIYFIGVRVLGKRAFCFHEGGVSVCDAYHSKALSDYTDNISGRDSKLGTLLGVVQPWDLDNTRSTNQAIVINDPVSLLPQCLCSMESLKAE